MQVLRYSRKRLSVDRRFGFKSQQCRRFHIEKDLLIDLKGRGLVSNISSHDAMGDLLDKGPVSVYMGIDPTAQALHVGHLLPLICLMHFHIRGHTVYPVIGGATGLIGDPAGRTRARDNLEQSRVEHNVQKLGESLRRFFERGIAHVESRWALSHEVTREPEVLNNLDWTKGLGLLDFLRVVGVHARMNTMLARESVRLRLASEEGMSYTEFSYQLLQAYDFYTLFTQKDCRIQIGGSDQWGNILAGQDLINRTVEPGRGSVVCMTTPLLTTSSGDKFGKSAGNAVWLDESMTSPFDFYQFFCRVSDEDAATYLKMLTLLPMDHIEKKLEAHKTAPELRLAQTLLADELTEFVHGTDGLRKARAATEALFSKEYTDLRAQDVLDALRGDPRLQSKAESELFTTPVIELATFHRLLPSMSAARKLVAAKGLYVNNQRVEDPGYTLQRSDMLDGRLAIIRAGRGHHLILVLHKEGETIH